MSLEQPLLRRAVFGYKPSDVDSLLAGRDGMLRHAMQRYQTAKDNATQLQSELSSARSALEEKDTEIASLLEQVAGLNGTVDELRAAAPEPTNAGKSGDVTSALMAEELGRILSVAEGSAERIVEQARVLSERQVQGADRLWSQVEAERRRFASWRGELEPRIRSAQAGIDEAIKRVDHVADRLQEAIAPAASAMSALVEELQQLAESSRPPLLVAPSHAPNGPMLHSPEHPETKPASTRWNPGTGSIHRR
jgi:chromosome segregation ATPase